MLRLQGLSPQVAADTRVLVLGSFPGVASLQVQQYYGHPRNQLWRLLGDSFGLPLAQADYSKRLQLLLANKIGLWDVIRETQRQGSLDSDIRDPSPSDLLALLAELPALRVIAFNGATAAKIGLRHLGPAADHYRILALPSSSPAYTLAYAGKLAAWATIADDFDGSSYE